MSQNMAIVPCGIPGFSRHRISFTGDQRGTLSPLPATTDTLGVAGCVCWLKSNCNESKNISNTGRRVGKSILTPLSAFKNVKPKTVSLELQIRTIMPTIAKTKRCARFDPTIYLRFQPPRRSH